MNIIKVETKTTGETTRRALNNKEKGDFARFQKQLNKIERRLKHELWISF